MCLGAVVACVAGGAAWLQYDLLPTNRALPGVSIGGEEPPADAPLGAWLERRRVELLEQEVVVHGPESYDVLTLGKLGVEVDVAATLARALEHAQAGSIGARLRRAWVARQGETDLPLAFAVDERRAAAALEEFAPTVFRAPQDARLDLERHQRVADRPGRELDVAASVRPLELGSAQPATVVELVTRAVPAEVTQSMLASIDVSQVLSSQETQFADSSKARAHNVRLAAHFLNGTVILPGQTVSFNRLVGPRRIERGFEEAPVIIDDELRPGVGGGTCQVASTLHAAAVMGALDVVQRRSHSRPSGYIALGLDATVIDGEVDLKLRNPYDEPLIIHAFVPRSRTLRVELLGRPPPGKVRYTYGVTEVKEFYRRVTTKPWIVAGRRIRRQRGIRGYEVVSAVRVERADGTSAVRYYRSSYRPTPEVYWVGPGYDLGKLPELPEGVTQTEVDGAPIVTSESDDDGPAGSGQPEVRRSGPQRYGRGG